ncbi:multidrug effflux MFS transporter [Maritimibacter sp. HL-12]|uniref:multidrug effflux MFS transporter n=1 Tax=Maritimibacter sp. HL-12 TaxID=1162418 RepID=UPI000A0EF97F|nr:multidrug effflux MFS transporter [Maritimibacter sp. HL-12]SMH55358.1 MFS transporter, DHA1 family, bicyclomycin/chloramphenicol resistance protein [Maritimibacter sp. HL-12]
MPRFPAPTRPLPFAELVLLLAALMSMMAFAIDSILPALPRIATEFIPQDPSRAQLVITAFVLGTGLGQLFIGPFSDSFGRRRALMLGVGLFIAGALGARAADSLETLLAFRVLQGTGAAASRIVSQAVMRDLFSGRAQARVGSIVFSFFVIVPAVAPLAGQQIIGFVGWRGLFASYGWLGALVLAWFLMRQPETLDPENRRAFRLGRVLVAMREVLATPVALRYLLVASLGFGQLMAYISSAQQVYVEALGAGDRFVYYFAGVALISGLSGFLNARMVMRLGMRPLASAAFSSQVLIAGVLAALWLSGAIGALPQGWQLAIFIAWSVTFFFMNGLTFGNITALAMEPLGHIAGTASAVIGALSSILAVAIAAPVGLAFDGTPGPLLAGVVICSALALWLIRGDRDRVRG